MYRSRKKNLVEITRSSDECQVIVEACHRDSNNMSRRDMADYMHVYVVFVHGYTVITSQLTLCVKSCAHDEYAHYINSDIAQWLDSRTYNNQPPLHKACNFVFIIPELQSEFYAFRDKIPSLHTRLQPLPTSCPPGLLEQKCETFCWHTNSHV